jgi:hypothetical protein
VEQTDPASVGDEAPAEEADRIQVLAAHLLPLHWKARSGARAVR